MTPEGIVKRDIKAHLSGIDSCWFFMPVPTGFGVRGIPDFVGCYRGRFFAIEAKRPAGGKLTPWQEKIATAIQRAGGLWFLATSVEDIRYVFQ